VLRVRAYEHLPYTLIISIIAKSMKTVPAKLPDASGTICFRDFQAELKIPFIIWVGWEKIQSIMSGKEVTIKVCLLFLF
jgi:hypothetical protein